MPPTTGVMTNGIKNKATQSGRATTFFGVQQKCYQDTQDDTKKDASYRKDERRIERLYEEWISERCEIIVETFKGLIVKII